MSEVSWVRTGRQGAGPRVDKQALQACGCPYSSTPLCCPAGHQQNPTRLEATAALGKALASLPPLPPLPSRHFPFSNAMSHFLTSLQAAKMRGPLHPPLLVFLQMRLMLMPSAAQTQLCTPHVLGLSVSPTGGFPEAHTIHACTHRLSRSKRKWQERRKRGSTLSRSPSGVPGRTATQGLGVRDPVEGQMCMCVNTYLTPGGVRGAETESRGQKDWA